MTPEEIESRLLYRDALMLVLNKPAGIPVHKGTGGGDNLEQHFTHLQFGLPRPPALAHRLDRDTSGCLVLGKLFEKNQIKKTYWAIVEGAPQKPEGIIDFPLEKKSQHKARWQMQVAETGGMQTITHYKVMGEKNGKTWLAMMPQTGRTHQLRVHAAAIGCPIVGDKIYGSKEPEKMLHLHAQEISVPLYPKKDAITVSAPVPEHMRWFMSS